MKVIAIVGSPSVRSRTQVLSQYVLTSLRQHYRAATASYSAIDFPAGVLLSGHYDHEVIQAFIQTVKESDGIVIATPIYKAAYTGVLKALLDLLPQDAFKNKVILPLASAGSLAHLLSLDYALKPVLSALGGRLIVDSVYGIEEQISLDEHNKAEVHPELKARLDESIEQLVHWIGKNQTAAHVIAQAA